MESDKKSLYGGGEKWCKGKVTAVDIKKITIVFVSVMVVVNLILIMPWLILMVGGYFSQNPGFPEITKNEFPVCLEYEINGRRIIVEDVLVCEFDGFGFSEGSGKKFRKWKAYLKSGNSRITLFKNDDIEIYYFPVKDDSRLPGVFMGDTEYYSGGTGGTYPDAWYTTNYEDKRTNDYIISAISMKEKYNLKLINWECPLPIQNSFRVTRGRR